jgi:hypothetical protein
VTTTYVMKAALAWDVMGARSAAARARDHAAAGGERGAHKQNSQNVGRGVGSQSHRWLL